MRSAQPRLTRLLMYAGLLALASPGIAAAQTGTSTRVTFPEDGGPLPRADIPEGGTPSWREPDDKPQGPSMTDEGQPRPPHADKVPAIPPGLTPDGKRRLDVRWRGYVRVVAEVVENDALQFIGRNDGFRLANARLGLSASYGPDLLAYVSLDAALAQATDLNDPNAKLAVGVRDAFIQYDFSRRASVRVGRFKAPYDLGALESTGARAFIDSPLESQGILRTQGLETRGMSQDRELGAMLFKERVGLSDDGFDLGYYVALTNGRTGDRAFNDSDTVAAFVRASLHYGPWVTVNLGGFMDTRTTGELPNLLDEEVWGAEGSVQLTYEAFKVEGQMLFQRLSPTTAGTPAFNALGVHGQWTYRIWQLEPGYRFAYFEPNDQVQQDVVTEHTIGISYYPGELPLRLSLNGTLPIEQRKVNNNRLSLLVQFSFE